MKILVYFFVLIWCCLDIQAANTNPSSEVDHDGLIPFTTSQFLPINHLFYSDTAMSGDMSNCKTFYSPEFDALKNLYFSLNGQHWVYPPNSVPWNFSSPNNNPCVEGWAFLTCYPYSTYCFTYTMAMSQVVGLQGSLPDVFHEFVVLSDVSFEYNNDLVGTIPFSLTNLTFLSSISLAYNSLSGKLPNNTFHGRYLKTCNMTGNMLTGNIPMISSKVSQSLYWLELDKNRLSGSIPTTISYIKSLLWFSASYNNLGGAFPSSICSLVDIILFSVESNMITGTLPDCIGYLTEVLRFTVTANNMTGTIPLSITGMTSVYWLGLDENEFSGTIPALANMQKLNYLLMSHNNLIGTIPSSLASCSSLISLWLHDNMLHGTIGSWIGSLTILRQLKLDHNRLTGTLPRELGRLSKLQYLFLFNNLLTGTLPSEYGDMNSMLDMDVHGNKLTGSVPEELGYLSNMIYLDLYDNRFTGSFPETFDYLFLIELSANTNFFTGGLPQLLSSQNLSFYNLYQNFFTGHIQNTFILREKLTVVAVYNNELSGSLTSGGYVPNLVMAYFQNNFFTGPLPFRFGGNVTSIQLGKNFLTGTLNPGLGALTSLNQLSLSTNLISGSIPESLGVQQPNLTTVELSDNMLVGTLPSGLFNGTKLTVFAAITNCLEGSIPDSICLTNQTLQTFSIDGFHAAATCHVPVFTFYSHASFRTYKLTARLSGTIPRCMLEDFSQLQTLHASGNGLKGSLPSDLQRVSPMLSDLALSHNLLSGTIPTVLLQRTQWQNLDLSFNKITGKLPDNMFSFRESSIGGSPPAISLSINRISGRVPSSVLDAKNISILAGNIFSCHYGNKNLLPTHDPDRTAYVCGSDGVDFAMSMMLNAIILVCVISAILYYVAHRAPYSCCSSKLLSETIKETFSLIFLILKHAELQSWVKLVDSTYVSNFRLVLDESIIAMKNDDVESVDMNEIPDDKDFRHRMIQYQRYPMIYMVFAMFAQIRRWLLAVFVFYLCVFLPVQITLTMDYSAIEQTYIYLASAAYTSGLIPVIVFLIILFIFYVLMFSNSFVNDLPIEKRSIISKILLSMNIFQIKFNVITEYWFARKQNNKISQHQLVRLQQRFNTSTSEHQGKEIIWEFMQYEFHPENDVFSPILLAASCGNLDKFIAYHRRLKEPIVTERTLSKKTALHIAAMMDHCKICEFLVECHPDFQFINAQDSHGNTALHLAAHRGNVEVILLLLNKSHSIDIGIKNHQGKQPVDLLPLKLHDSLQEALHQLIPVSEDHGDQKIASPLHNVSQSTVTPTKKQGTSKSQNQRQRLWQYVATIIIKMKQELKPTKAHIQLGFFVMFNIGFVLSVNMVYIYITSTAFNGISSKQKQFVAIAISIYKLGWNSIVDRSFRSLLWKNKFQAVSRKRVAHDEIGLMKILHGKEIFFYFMLVFMSVFNNIIAPCLAMIVFSPNCFYYTFTPSKPIISSYSYSWIGYSGRTPVSLSTNGLYSFNSPFIYSDQCSSTLASDFSDVFIYRFLIGSWIMPLLFLSLKDICNRVRMNLLRTDLSERQRYVFSVIYFIVDKYCLPTPLRPSFDYHSLLNDDVKLKIDHYERHSGIIWSTIERPLDRPFYKSFLSRRRNIFNMHYTAATIVTDICIILTFGSVFPPLGLVGILSLVVSLSYTQCLVGRFLTWEENDGTNEINRFETLLKSTDTGKELEAQLLRLMILQRVNQECEHLPILLLMSISIGLLVAISTFWSFFQFDIYADKVGTTNSYWVIGVMIVGLPGIIILANATKWSTEVLPKWRKRAAKIDIPDNTEDIELTTMSDKI